MNTHRYPTLILALLLLPLLACSNPRRDDDDSGDDDDAADDDDTASDPCEGIEQVSGTDVELDVFATGLSSPVHITHAGDGSGRVFVVEQGGTIVELDADGGNRREWLDINNNISCCGERGLLSMAFHPGFATNGRFYVYYTASPGGGTVVSELQVEGDPLTGLPDDDTERILLSQNQPASNHNGGQIAFGPDGYLYIGLGDGGGAGDTYGNGQRPDTFQSKILRIDVDGGDPYGVPDDNPFIGVGNHRPETWAWGLRNPWRFSFDRETGDLWIADVGQNQWEEIHLGSAGGNYGWPEMEGNNCFTSGCDPSDFEPAIHEYTHSAGISITGGFVYRGCALPDLHGVYFYSDYNYFNSPLWTLTWDGNNAQQGPVNVSGVGGLVSSFGEDELGEIYVADHSGDRVWKIVPE